ncbi:hypothetical protein Tco_0121536 [Tanacetum coccineum]
MDGGDLSLDPVNKDHKLVSEPPKDVTQGRLNKDQNHFYSTKSGSHVANDISSLHDDEERSLHDDASLNDSNQHPTKESPAKPP